jgi:hypothetical protein
MIKISLIFSLVCTLLFGLNVPKVGDSVLPVTLKTQFDKVEKITNDTEIILYFPDKTAYKIVEAFFKTQNKEYLALKKAVLIADVSAAPSFVISMFIKPNLRDLGHKVFVIDDDMSPVIFPSHLEEISVVRLREGKIVSMAYCKTLESFKEKF